MQLAKSDINYFPHVFPNSWLSTNPETARFLVEILWKVFHLIRLTEIKRLDVLGREHKGDHGELVNKQLGRIPIPY